MADFQIDPASLSKFAAGMEELRQHFQKVGGPATELDLDRRPDVQASFADHLWYIEHSAVQAVSGWSTEGYRRFHGMGYLAVDFGAKVGAADDAHARRILAEAHKAVPAPRPGLPDPDPQLAPDFIDPSP